MRATVVALSSIPCGLSVGRGRAAVAACRRRRATRRALSRVGHAFCAAVTLGRRWRGIFGILHGGGFGPLPCVPSAYGPSEGSLCSPCALRLVVAAAQRGLPPSSVFLIRDCRCAGVDRRLACHVCASTCVGNAHSPLEAAVPLGCRWRLRWFPRRRFGHCRVCRAYTVSERDTCALRSAALPCAPMRGSADGGGGAAAQRRPLLLHYAASAALPRVPTHGDTTAVAVRSAAAAHAAQAALPGAPASDGTAAVAVVRCCVSSSRVSRARP